MKLYRFFLTHGMRFKVVSKSRQREGGAQIIAFDTFFWSRFSSLEGFYSLFSPEYLATLEAEQSEKYGLVKANLSQAYATMQAIRKEYVDIIRIYDAYYIYTCALELLSASEDNLHLDLLSDAPIVFNEDSPFIARFYDSCLDQVPEFQDEDVWIFHIRAPLEILQVKSLCDILVHKRKESHPPRIIFALDELIEFEKKTEFAPYIKQTLSLPYPYEIFVTRADLQREFPQQFPDE